MAMLNRIRRKRFGEILVSEGLITKDQLDEALELQKSSGDFLGAILLELGHITETDIIKTLSIQYQLPFLRPTLYDLDRRLMGKFKPEFLHLHKILPIDQIGNLLLLLVTDIPSDEILGEIQELSQSNLAIYIGSISEVDQILREIAPLTEDQEEDIRHRRKGSVAEKEEVLVGVEAPEGASPSSSSAVVKKKTAFQMDASWESIFDEAEGKVKPK
jgi:type IV pilus assembly protein PilB